MGRGRGRGRGSRGGPNNKTNSGSSTSSSQPECQVCGKKYHTTKICWYRYDEDTNPEPRTATMASSSSGTDPNWYTNFGVMDHITGTLDKLTMHDPTSASIKFMQQMAHVWILPVLVKPLFPPPSAILLSIMFFMFLLPTRILFSFIVLPLIMTYSLSFIRIFS
jgi:hypothetical protein